MSGNYQKILTVLKKLGYSTNTRITRLAKMNRGEALDILAYDIDENKMELLEELNNYLDLVLEKVEDRVDEDRRNRKLDEMLEHI
jgi:hypothetical protein